LRHAENTGELAARMEVCAAGRSLECLEMNEPSTTWKLAEMMQRFRTDGGRV